MTKSRPRPASERRDCFQDTRLQRAYVQADFGSMSIALSKGDTKSETVKTLKRDGDVLLVLGDSDQHERRIQRVALSTRDRLFWVTIAIACGRPGAVSGLSRKRAGNLAKEYGTLAKARNDLDAFYEYYRPMRLGNPFIVGPGGIGKSPGYFDCAANLDNPNVKQLENSILGLRKWLAINQEDPEYRGFQLNFCFSGHGDVNGGASIVLADAKLSANELASMLLAIIPEAEHSQASHRLDLFLDCCHSGAIARTIVRDLWAVKEERYEMGQSLLEVGQVYCACLDDENAFEFNQLRQSVFTFAFLNECSRRRPHGAKATNLGLRDIGWYTNSEQHPLLVDFTEPEHVTTKFPPSYYLTHSPRPSGSRPPEFPAMDLDRFASDPIGELLMVARAQRAECFGLEKNLKRRRSLRIPYSRDEILTNEKFPFL